MLYSLLNVVVTQAYIARPFLEAEPWSYLRYSFDFSRAFLYKWTVNWRFVSEDIFLSRQWAVGLLIGHAAVLALFGLFRWCRKDGNSWIVMRRAITRLTLPAGTTIVTPDCRCSLICAYPSTQRMYTRCRDGPVHFEFDWDHFCSIASLPVLLVVCPTNPFLDLENAISPCRQVSCPQPGLVLWISFSLLGSPSCL